MGRPRLDRVVLLPVAAEIEMPPGFRRRRRRRNDDQERKTLF